MNALLRFRTPVMAILVVVVAMAAGCNGALVGSWKADPEPKDMPAYISTASFKNDNTYTVVEKKGEATDKFAGTYDFTNFGTTLKLKSPGKPDRVYKAMYVMFGNKLELTGSDNKKVVLKKQ